MTQSTAKALRLNQTGDWTRALYDMAAGSKGPESFRAGKTTAKVIVEGPYGGPGNNLFDSYGAVMLVAGGSGITHTLGVTATLISKAASHGSVRASFLNVIWIVRTQDVARPLMSTFRSLIEDAKLAQCNLAVRFQIYVTRESAAEINLLSNAAKDQMNAPVTMPGTMTSGGLADLPISWPCGTNSRIEIIAGSRPAFNGLLTELIDSAVSFDEEMGLARQGCGIAVCGPSGLCDSVRESVQRIDAKRKLRVGGIELLEESFS
jgi:ferric-chelate reductase